MGIGIDGIDAVILLMLVLVLYNVIRCYSCCRYSSGYELLVGSCCTLTVVNHDLRMLPVYGEFITSPPTRTAAAVCILYTVFCYTNDMAIF